MIENEQYKPSFTKSPITDKMRDDVESFKRKFELKYGLTPYVSINTRKSYMGDLDLMDLLEIINNKMRQNREAGTASILDSTRKRPIITYRQLFCKVAMGIGYGPTSISKFINRNHATVIHSVHLMDNLIDTGDKEITRLMNEMHAELEKYLSERQYEEVF